MSATHTHFVKVIDSAGGFKAQTFTWNLSPAVGPVNGGFTGSLYANGIQSSLETVGCCPKTAAEIANERIIDDHIALSFSATTVTAPIAAGFPGEGRINASTGEYYVYNYPGTWAYYAPKKGLSIVDDLTNKILINTGSAWIPLTI
jgi:hypothetical protein